MTADYQTLLDNIGLRHLAEHTIVILINGCGPQLLFAFFLTNEAM